MNANPKTGLFSHKVPPNAANFMNSFRSLNYSDKAAIHDILDNALDAGAKIIKITIGGVKGKDLGKQRSAKNVLYVNEITIVDDGRGMDVHKLDQFLRLGSISDHDREVDLGIFGTGAKAAAFSLGRRLEIRSRCDDTILQGILDLDIIKEQNDFVALFGPTENEDNMVHGTGTVVSISKIDRLDSVTVDSLSKRLKNSIGQLFNKFITSGRDFFVNNEKVPPYDPLLWDNKGTVRHIDEEILINNEPVQIKLALIDKGDLEENDSLKDNEGFHIYRNNRCIDSAVTAGFYKRYGDNYMNRFRGEISFSGKLDEQMGVNIQKQFIKLSQSTHDILSPVVKPCLNSIRNQQQQKLKAQPNKEIEEAQDKAMKEIRQKSSLLVMPSAEKEVRNPPTNTSKKTSHNEESGNRNVGNKTQSGKPWYKIKNVSMGVASSMFQGFLEGRVLTIHLNTDHPFYNAFFLKAPAPNRKAASMLVAMFAQSDILFADKEDSQMIWHSIKYNMDQNLRVLLK